MYVEIDRCSYACICRFDNIPEEGAPGHALVLVVARMLGRLVEGRVVAGVHPVPLQRVPHILLHLEGRRVLALIAVQTAVAPASAETEGLQRGRHLLDGLAYLLM